MMQSCSLHQYENISAVATEHFTFFGVSMATNTKIASFVISWIIHLNDLFFIKEMHFDDAKLFFDQYEKY